MASRIITPLPPQSTGLRTKTALTPKPDDSPGSLTEGDIQVWHGDQLLGWLCWSPTQEAYYAARYAMPIDYSTYYRCVAEGLAYFEEQLS